MKRIAFVCLNGYKLFNPASSAQIGGSEVQMVEIATKLSEYPEYEVAFIVGDFGQQNVERHGNITVYKSFPLKKQVWSLIIAPYLMWTVLTRIQPDVIISSPAGPETGILALYARLFRKRYIFRAASDIDCTGEKAAMMDPVSRFFYELGIRLATSIVVQHGKQQEHIKHTYNKESVCIENGYEIPISQPRQKNNEIIWIGSSRTVKRPDIFFELARSMPEYTFGMILSHSGDKEIYETSQHTATTVSNIHFYGEQSPTDTNTILEQSRILVGTSNYEGSPNTYIAAYMRNTPVVSLNVPCFGYCARGNIETMKQHIRELMSSTEQYSSMQRDAHTKASVYDISRVILKWISLLQ